MTEEKPHFWGVFFSAILIPSSVVLLKQLKRESQDSVMEFNLMFLEKRHLKKRLLFLYYLVL